MFSTFPNFSQFSDHQHTMIMSFRHRGLKALYEGSSRRVPPAHVKRLMGVLEALDHSHGPEGMNLQGLRLHKLEGKLKESYAVWVSGNWRVTFRFQSGKAVDVNYLDYH